MAAKRRRPRAAPAEDVPLSAYQEAVEARHLHAGDWDPNKRPLAPAWGCMPRQISPHILFIRPGGFRCDRCGVSHVFEDAVNLEIVVLFAVKFEEQHRDCEAK